MVVVDHHDSYTWNLVHLVASVTGVLPRVVQHDEVSAAEVLAHAYVVLSPGPGHPADPADFAVGREVLLAGTRPVLGVCLGMQGLVTAYGGTVERVRAGPRRRRDGDPRRVGALRRAAGTASPRCATTRWASPRCPTSWSRRPWSEDGVVMGVRHRTLPLEGVQFHPESILSEHGRRLVANFLGPT